MKKLLSIAAFSLIGTASLASGSKDTDAQTAQLENTGTMTYELFETAITHADLDSCPDGFDPQVTFCRLTVASGMVHVFVFTNEDDQPLIAVRSYDLEDSDLLSF